MKAFVPVTEPVEADFFRIDTFLGVRYLHIFGYSYKSSYKGYATEDNPDGTYWGMTDVTGFFMHLDEFIAGYKQGGVEYVDSVYEDCKQYQDDQTAEQAVATINGYFDGQAPKAVLSFAELTMDTPDGDYMNIY